MASTQTSPTVIMLAGLQGSGKTTLAGKLAKWLAGQGHQPMLVAADLQRPKRGAAAAGGRRAGRRGGLTPPSRAAVSATRSRWPADSIEEARRRQHDIVIVDTAGRLGVDTELMAAGANIRDAVSPDEILFVGRRA